MTVAGTIGAALAEARARLRRAGIETAALDARVLASCAFGMSAEELIRDQLKPAPQPAREQFLTALARRAQGEPVAYITGRREFWSLDFAVGPGCLIPRPDSEAVVAAVLEAAAVASPLRILDLGTGSGCLLLALLSEMPKASGVGVDADPRAIRTARANAVGLGLADRAMFLAGDWASALAGRFDVIVANPPYVPSADIAGLARDVRDFEPLAALDGGADGLDALRAVMAAAARALCPGGRLALEFGPGQAAEVERLGGEIAGLARAALIADLAGRTRGILFRRREDSGGGSCAAVKKRVGK